jgi:hypothetical protein
MAEMRLVVVGAAGRMGQMLVKTTATLANWLGLERWACPSPTIRSRRCSRPMA